MGVKYYRRELAGGGIDAATVGWYARERAGVTQSGRVPAFQAGCRGFESRLPPHRALEAAEAVIQSGYTGKPVSVVRMSALRRSSDEHCGAQPPASRGVRWRGAMVVPRHCVGSVGGSVVW